MRLDSVAHDGKHHAFDPRAFDHARALSRGVLEEQLIEAAAVNVIRVILRETELGNFAEANHVLASVRPVRPDRAVFVDELFALHHAQEINVLKNPGCRADKRLSDVRPGMHRLIDNHVVKLKSTGADVFVDITTPKFAAQAIKKVAEIEWKPLHFLNNVSASLGSVRWTYVVAPRTNAAMTPTTAGCSG